MNSRNFSHQSNVFFSCSLLGRNFTAFVQRVTLPGISFANIELSKTAVKFYTQGDTPTYNPLSVDLILDDNLELWREIATKLQTMTEEGGGDMLFQEFDSFIHIFNEKDKSILKIQFKHCFIEALGDIDYDATADDAELTLNLTINYAYYVFDKYHAKDEKAQLKGYRNNAFVKRNHFEEIENG